MSAPDVVTHRFRDAIKRASPQWLTRGIAEKVLYALGLHIDILGDAAVSAVKLRFPGLYSYDSLPYLGRDRKIRRGLNETDAVYATRLLRWLDDHKRRGGPYAMLRQLYAHYATAPFAMALTYKSGKTFAQDAAGVITRRTIAWNPDFDDARWARWWLFLSWPDAVVDDGLWGSPGTWGDGGVWGSSLTVAQVEDLLTIPIEWNAAHTKGVIVLLAPGGELWGYPDGPWSDPGVWGGGGTATVDVP